MLRRLRLLGLLLAGLFACLGWPAAHAVPAALSASRPLLPVVSTSPTASGQTVAVLKNTPQPITLQGGALGSVTLTFSIVATPTHGNLGSLGTPACQSGRSTTCTAAVTYTPATNYSGPDSFTFKVNDGSSDSTAATVSLTISASATNGAPVATNEQVSATENTAKPLLVAATDPDSPSLTFAIVAGPSHGSLGTLSTPSCSPAGAGSTCTAAVTYTPTTGYTGPDSFTFKANDGASDSNTATVTLAISAPAANTPPTAAGQSATTAQNTPLPLTLHASDPDSASLSFSIVSNPAHGSLGSLGSLGTPACAAGRAGTTCTASVTYTPTSTYTGPDAFTFKANDGTADSTPATVSLTVGTGSASLAPTAEGQSATTAENTAKPLTLTASDPDSPSLTFSIVASPSHGSLGSLGTPACTALRSGSICTASVTYTPSSTYTGPDSFTFKANDGKADSNVATVTLTVAAAPVAAGQSVTTVENTAKPITLSATDPDHPSVTFSIVSNPTHGSLGTLGTPSCSPSRCGQ
jgi:hypothetical protein